MNLNENQTIKKGWYSLNIHFCIFIRKANKNNKKTLKINLTL